MFRMKHNPLSVVQWEKKKLIFNWKLAAAESRILKQSSEQMERQFSEPLRLIASTSRVESLVISLTHYDPRDLGLICLEKKRKIRCRILSDLRIQSWIFLKKRTFSLTQRTTSLVEYPPTKTALLCWLGKVKCNLAAILRKTNETYLHTS